MSNKPRNPLPTPGPDLRMRLDNHTDLAVPVEETAEFADCARVVYAYYAQFGYTESLKMLRSMIGTLNIIENIEE